MAGGVRGGTLVPPRRDDDPDRWWEAAYASAAVITQVDDGHPAGPDQRGRYVTSLASQPDTTTGYPVTVLTGDGAQGYSLHAPYDRIIATAAVQRVPYPWVAQTHPGGVILTPWVTPYHNGALVRLTVSADGTAEGRIAGDVSFMQLRDQRFRASVNDDECDETTARTSHTNVALYQVAGDYDASLAIGMKVPHCTPIYVSADHYPDYARLWFVDPTTSSWANLVHQPDTRTYPVHQSGPRNLWDEIETAYHWWCCAGRPGRQQWRITISPQGQFLTLAI